MSECVVIACSRTGLRWAAERAAAGAAVRVLQVGALVGVPYERVDGPEQLKAWRDAWGGLCWAPSVGAGLIGAAADNARLVTPTRGWEHVFDHHVLRIRSAGGDVVPICVEQVAVEEGSVVGVDTDCGYEWVEDLFSDAHDAVIACFIRGEALPASLVCTEVRCRLGVRAGADTLPPNVCADPLTPDEVFVTVQGSERARDRAMGLLTAAGMPGVALSTRQGPRPAREGVRVVQSGDFREY